MDPIYHAPTQSWLAVCWTYGYTSCPANLAQSTCNDACFTPPPECSDGKCACGINGEIQPSIGDPVNALTGETINIETDLELTNSVAPLKLTRHFTSSVKTWAQENLVGQVPKPFGASAANSNSLNWWHEYYSFIRLGSTSWVVVKGTGSVTRFTPCTGATCTATPSGGSANKRERLQRISTGFVLTEAGGRKSYFEAKHIQAGGTLERYFLSRIVSPSGVEEATLSYADPPGLSCPPGNTGTAVGVPYLASVSSSSNALDFQYTNLTPTSGAPECVLRSVTRRGESTPAVTYSYTLDSGSVERPGQLAQAALSGRTITYSYTSNAFTSSVYSTIGNLLITKHDYATDGTVSASTTGNEQLTLGALTASTCVAGSNCCGVQPQKRTVYDAAAGRGDGVTGSTGYNRTYEILADTTQSATPRLYQTTDACTVANACSAGTERYEWACAAGGLPAYEKARKNKRDFWEVYTYAAPAAGTGVPASVLEKTGIKRGAQDMTGTGALEEKAFAYTYGPNGEQLLASEERPSVLGAAGQKARIFHRYDTTGRKSATIQSGWTRVFDSATGTWISQQRWIGTFFLTTRTGESTPDSLGRTVEEHGPCFVTGEAATDCPSGSIFPITQTFYWAATETTPRRNQRQKEARYPAGLTSVPVETFFNAYDASGHVTETVDANGVTTLYTYFASGKVSSQTVRLAGQPDAVTSYGYDGAGHLTSVRHPEGNYELFCYGTALIDYCAGPLSDKLQWKAKSSNVMGTGWAEKVTYTYWPDGTLKEESYKDISSVVRKVMSYAADAHQRPSWKMVGNGVGNYRAMVKSYDGSNNITGVGNGFNIAPAWCAAGADGQPTSDQCSAMQYDRADRLQRIDEHPLSGVTTRTCVKHDAHGNVTSVDSGLSATVDCATAVPSANASRYQFDDFGHAVEVALASMGSGSTAGITRFAYDAAGNLVVKQTPAMAAAHARDHLASSFDAMGRLVATVHNSPLVSGGAEGLFSQGYDVSASIDASCGTLSNTRGRLLYKDDSFGRTWFSYDAQGRKLREVRLRAGTTTCNPGTPFQNPHTAYTYTPNGNLKQVTYPYGRTVTYNYGTGALTDRVESVYVWRYSGGGVSTNEPLVSQIAWEPYGGLRGYRTHYVMTGATGSVEYARGGDASAAATCATTMPSAATGDKTGRIRALWVSTLAANAEFVPGSGNGSVLKQFYSWQADQLVDSYSCLLGATSARTEHYSQDWMLRLTGATGTLTTEGGAYTSRSFGYDSRSNRTTEAGEANSWALTYTNTGHPDQLVSRSSTQTDAQLGHSYTYDADGRASKKSWHPVDSQGNAFHLDFTSGPSSNGGSETVFKTVSVNGLTYNYFYDSQGQRRLKDYPTGIKDEYFYNQSQGLIVDQGNASSLASTSHPVDEYVWLDGKPIAVLRGKLDASWQHLSDGTTDCARDGQGAACGFYHLVTDYQGKPVLTLDDSGRVAGTGEYDAFGHVNRVSVDIETPHPYTVSTSGPFGTVMKQPTIAGTSLQQRVLFDSSDLWSDFEACTDEASQGRDDTITIRDEATSTALATRVPWQPGRAFTPWFTPSTSGVRAVLNNTGFSACFRSGSTCACSALPRTKEEQGAVISAYEYRRFQTGAAPFWTPLRFPGQYHDAETDLFENWNRYYDPSIGRYLQPEPLLLDPQSILVYAAEGRSLAPYAYALNNPTGFVDPTGKNPGIIVVGVGVGIGEALVSAGVITAGVYCIGTQCLGDLNALLKSRWEKAKEAIRDICQKPRDKWYACAAACQGNGARSGADYLVGWSNQNCADATRRAKVTAEDAGQKYGRHCLCFDTDGFNGEGKKCENHAR
ncbi:RHS repeat-associated core domain-containing protein [Corallococcus exercitus]|uniref:RHS repeat-associated core domain-containing protein n=1 Tax=Corallococcus exercitus TaxID=2316736 RepID=UPI0035D4B256